jgi:hypothetical protein
MEEEKRKPPHAAGPSAKPAPTAESERRKTGLEPERNAYFGGRYSQAMFGGPGAVRMSLDMIVDHRMAEFGVPNSLRHCVMDLIQILREHGIGAALTALHNDPAIDARHQASVGRLLAAVADSGVRP